MSFFYFSVVTLPQILDILVPAGKVTQEVADNTLAYLKTNRSVLLLSRHLSAQYVIHQEICFTFIYAISETAYLIKIFL